MLAVRPTSDAVNPRVRPSRSRSAIDPAIVISMPSRTHVMPRAMTTRQWNRLHGSRSIRAGTVLRVGLTPRTSAVICPPSSRSRRVKAVKAAAKYPPSRRATRGTPPVPELPEVEALAAFLRDRAVGHAVARVDVLAVAALKTYEPPPSALHGLAIDAVARHGKFLDLSVSGLHLVVHLARAGWLQWKDALPAAPPRPGRGPLALRVHLDDGSGFDLTEAGTQKRLAAYVVRWVADVPGVAALGVDPLAADFGPERLAALLGAAPRTQLKGLLRDQAVLAGVGNAYSDEILHAARLSPFKLAGSLTREETSRLYDAVVGVLAEAVERARGVAAGALKAEKKSGLRVHARVGAPCPVCGDTIRSVSFADSSLEYCPTCQTGGKPLADRRRSRFVK